MPSVRHRCKAPPTRPAVVVGCRFFVKWLREGEEQARLLRDFAGIAAIFRVGMVGAKVGISHSFAIQTMSDLYSMLSTIAQRRKPVNTSPFATRKSAVRWLQTLSQQSDYDTHHGVVEGLERFNGETTAATDERLSALMVLEEAGLPLQAKLVEQYVHNQASFKLAKKALWRESHMFWSQLALAYLTFFKHIFRDPGRHELQYRVADIAVRALRYAGLAMRWEYHQGQLPCGTAWCRLDKIYRLAERGGYANTPLALGGGTTHCAREFALIHLMGMVHPVGYRAQEIESIARLFQAHPDLPLPVEKLDLAVHTHAVDLSDNEGLFALEGQWVPGKRLRYMALGSLQDYLKNIDSGVNPAQMTEPGMANLGQQLASMIERGGVRRAGARTSRFGRVWVATGMDSIMAVLTQSGDLAAGRPALEPWMMRDESETGMGFTLDSHHDLPLGRLIAVSWDPSESVWQMLAVRWKRNENGKNHIGTQRLTRHPKLVYLSGEGGNEEIKVLFLPMSDNTQGVSNLLIPASVYSPGKQVVLRDGEVIYRLRLGEALETHESWLRVGMHVLARECLDRAA